jgi:IclR family transcriptional regulator, acetate operon repressor
VTPTRGLGAPADDSGAVPLSANQRNVSVGKAVALLRAAARHPDGASVSQLARAARIPRATALRMIVALESESLLTRIADGDRVLLGTGLLELAAAVRPERLLIEAAREPMQVLAEATHETITLAVRHGDEIVGIDEIPGSHLIGPTTWVGRSWPLQGTASGRIATGVVPADGVAESIDEIEVGLASIAAAIPLTGSAGAYVTVSGPTFRFGPDERAAAGRYLLVAVAEIAGRAGSSDPERHRRHRGPTGSTKRGES